MSVYFISDLHFGHKNVLKFEPVLRSGNTFEENMFNIGRNWENLVGKRDLVWVLGDCAFTQEGFDLLKSLPGRKKLIRGNHDTYFKTEQWLEIFETVESLVSYKGYWLSHCPVHPDELRGKHNIHGHVHSNSIMHNTGIAFRVMERDPRYINVCCEAVNDRPVFLDDIRDGTYWEDTKC